MFITPKEKLARRLAPVAAEILAVTLFADVDTAVVALARGLAFEAVPAGVVDNL